MSQQITDDEIDDLLYFARIGDWKELVDTLKGCCARDNTSFNELFLAVKDPFNDNGPLHMAAANGHTEVLTEIIKVLSNTSPQNPALLAILNSQNVAGNTALHWAALNGHLPCVKALLDSGADPTIANVAGHDAVYEAELNDQKEVVDWVLEQATGLDKGVGNDNEDEVETEEVIAEEAAGVKAGGNDADADAEALEAQLNNVSVKDES